MIGYGIRGALWYQGESNSKDGRLYQPKLESLITGWRKVWGMGEFPFYFVQLPGIGKSLKDHAVQGDGRAEIRQAYFETLGFWFLFPGFLFPGLVFISGFLFPGLIAIFSL